MLATWRWAQSISPLWKWIYFFPFLKRSETTKDQTNHTFPSDKRNNSLVQSQQDDVWPLSETLKICAMISYILYSCRQHKYVSLDATYDVTGNLFLGYFFFFKGMDPNESWNIWHSFSVKVVITSFTERFLTQKSHVSELIKVVRGSVSDLFQRSSVTCWRCCIFKFRSCWIIAHRPYPGKNIIDVPLKSTR